MIRTQVYLDDDIHTNLIRQAASEDKSMAELTRDILKEGLLKRKDADPSGKRVLHSIAGLKLKKEGDPYLSANIDHYLYNAPKKRS